MNRLHNASDRLINAWMKDALIHADCKKCAVGTLCSGRENWSDHIARSGEGWLYKSPEDVIDLELYEEMTKYSMEELGEIEYAFEQVSEIDSNGCVTFARRYNATFEALSDVFDKLIELEPGYDEQFNLADMVESGKLLLEDEGVLKEPVLV